VRPPGPATTIGLSVSLASDARLFSLVRSVGITRSLDAHRYGCIIQPTYGFGLAPLLRGKLFQVEEWEEREGERLCEPAEGALVDRSDFADEPLRVEEARLREVRHGLPIVDLPEREVEAANTGMPDEGDAEERLRVEGRMTRTGRSCSLPVPSSSLPTLTPTAHHQISRA
jgi:hypothetical protein